MTAPSRRAGSTRPPTSPRCGACRCCWSARTTCTRWARPWPATRHADFGRLEPEDRFRDVLELDSLDFLTLVELLSERTGVRIDEDDYPELDTLSGAVAFLVGRTAGRT
ncbi:acyl carrier protein [Streptomyces sp. NPDC005706]|uniref:acyl carrier protein n=1 Tax=Streptomyces sp. NPDC005706 TaxID=3157169 RepID=UPI0033D9232A